VARAPHPSLPTPIILFGPPRAVGPVLFFQFCCLSCGWAAAVLFRTAAAEVLGCWRRQTARAFFLVWFALDGMKKKWEDDAESEPGQHGADVALAAGWPRRARWRQLTAPGTVHVATAVNRPEGLGAPSPVPMGDGDRSLPACPISRQLMARFFPPSLARSL